ncbi:MAG: anthranilate synthase component II [Phycisphaerae bacterium]
MIVVIDNYDSFTYNLVQVMGALELGREIKVVRNDAVTIDELASFGPRHIVISPGPGVPAGAGISVEAVRRFGADVPLLGVCLGHQCIAEALGGCVVRAPRLMHGKTSPIKHDGRGVYDGLPNPFVATRYHSLTVDRNTLPPELEVTATTDRDELMGLRHKTMPIEGVQFHPESFLTDVGSRLVANFLRT